VNIHSPDIHSHLDKVAEEVFFGSSVQTKNRTRVQNPPPGKGLLEEGAPRGARTYAEVVGPIPAGNSGKFPESRWCFHQENNWERPIL